MAKTDAPNGNDLQAFLVAGGLFTNPPSAAQKLMDLDSYVAASKNKFEYATGFEPFMAASSASTRYFTPNHSDILEIGGLLSITSLLVGVSTSFAGTTLTKDQDYFLMPENASTKGKPYTYIRFVTTFLGDVVTPGSAYGTIGRYGLPNSVAITATWGRVANGTFPDDAFQAILSDAANSLMPTLSAALTGGMVAVTLGEDKFEFARRGGAGIFAQEQTDWKSQWSQTVARYQRKVVWGPH